MTSKRLQIKINKSSKQSEVSLAGEWTVLLLSSLEQKMDDLVKNSSNSILLDASAISKIDTAGSVLICSSIEKLKTRGVNVKFTQGSEEKISYTKENPFLNMPVGNENKNYQLFIKTHLFFFNIINCIFFFSLISLNYLYDLNINLIYTYF